MLGCLLAGIVGLLLAGCVTEGVSPTNVPEGEPGPGSYFFGPGDVIRMANAIGDRIAQNDRIMNATRAQYIVVDRAINQTTFAELTRSDSWTEKLMTELSKRKEFYDKVFFISRERAVALERERKLKEGGSVSGASTGTYAGADYTLGGKFMEQTTVSGNMRQTLIDVVYTVIENNRGVEIAREGISMRRFGRRSDTYN